MAKEIELKLLGVAPQEIRKFLTANKATFDAVYNFKRVIFDVVPTTKDAWIRLRTDGQTTTLTYKNIHSDEIDGTEEIEIIVDSFTETKSLLEKSGLVSRNYQENIREQYFWQDCQITIDSWPMLDPYVEIESTSKELVNNCLAKFSGLYSSTTTDSTDKLYTDKGIDLRSMAELKLS